MSNLPRCCYRRTTQQSIARLLALATRVFVQCLVLDQAARLLGVQSEDLAQALTNRTSYVRKELYTVLLSPQQSALQRDQLVRDLAPLRR